MTDFYTEEEFNPNTSTTGYHIPNRKTRRNYAQQLKKDPRADICPICKTLSLFFTYAKSETETEVRCALCGGTVFSGPKTSKLFPPGIYLPYKLDIFRMALNGVKDNENSESEAN